MNHFILLVAVDLEISWDGTEESDDVRLSKENIEDKCVLFPSLISL